MSYQGTKTVFFIFTLFIIDWWRGLESFDEALEVKDLIKWDQAMDGKIWSFEKNVTRELIEFHVEKKALSNKRVFRINIKLDGKVRFKAWLVLKGYSQRKCIDYNKIFSLLVKLTTIRICWVLFAIENLHLEHMDVKLAFLHRDLEEEIYMKQPESDEIPYKEHIVCMLMRNLYGLK